MYLVSISSLNHKGKVLIHIDQRILCNSLRQHQSLCYGTCIVQQEGVPQKDTHT